MTKVWPHCCEHLCPSHVPVLFSVRTLKGASSSGSQQRALLLFKFTELHPVTTQRQFQGRLFAFNSSSKVNDVNTSIIDIIV